VRSPTGDEPAPRPGGHGVERDVDVAGEGPGLAGSLPRELERATITQSTASRTAATTRILFALTRPRPPLARVPPRVSADGREESL
jgi:hypothetical protein